jgi:hypothetical protein
MPMSNYSSIAWREQVTFWWDDDDAVNFVLDQHAGLKQQSAGKHVAPLENSILISAQPVCVLTP